MTILISEKQDPKALLLNFSVNIMGFSIFSQQILFFRSIAFGAFLCLVYCIFRILRTVLIQYPASAFILDFIYFIFTAVSSVIFIFAVNNGEIRIFILLSIIIGWILFFFTIGRLISLSVKKSSEKLRKKCRKGLK